jgi:hypothetical protein
MDEKCWFMVEVIRIVKVGFCGKIHGFFSRLMGEKN